AFAQAQLRGRVVDAETGAPLSGATVSIVSAGLVTASDAEGHFTFSLSQQILARSPDLRIELRALGYRTQEAIWQPEAEELIIRLHKANLTLDEVVISRTLPYSN